MQNSSKIQKILKNRISHVIDRENIKFNWRENDQTLIENIIIG